MTRVQTVQLRIASVAVALLSLCAVAMTAAADDAINWGECPPITDGFPDIGQQQCALIPVPLDYRQPHGRKIDIAVSRIKASDPTKRRGVLFLNTGGPGGMGLDAPHLATALFPQSVLDAYDLIGFDPRGIGRSAPVTCGLTQEQAFQAFPQLEQSHSFAKTAEFARFVADACAGAMSDTLPFINTANTARDMDVIRARLGERTISYFAWSYGTYLGAVYASLFPAHADRFVLDSAVNPDWPWREQFRHWGPGGEARFADFAAYAIANEATLHLGRTADEVRALYFDLLAKSATNPISFAGFFVDAPTFRVLNFSFLYNDGSFPAMASLWQAVRDGASDGTSAAPTGAAAAAGYPAIPEDNYSMSTGAVLCDDVAWPRSIERYRWELQFDEHRFPMFGQLGSHIWSCAFWRVQPTEPLVNLTPHGPANHILILNTLRDPATPLPGARRMRESLGERSRLVLVDGGGHAIFGLMDNICATQTVAAYLADGHFPSADTTCPANASTAQDAKMFDTRARTDSTREQAIEAALRQMTPLHR
ncbi:MAG TPA: alpha/beta hydrolase [Steroidobacteraceae bacterium]|nr:alpha/beta hydrolase [Steroidobacteraceae bacterium]